MIVRPDQIGTGSSRQRRAGIEVPRLFLSTYLRQRRISLWLKLWTMNCGT